MCEVWEVGDTHERHWGRDTGTENDTAGLLKWVVHLKKNGKIFLNIMVKFIKFGLRLAGLSLCSKTLLELRYVGGLKY